MFAPRTDVIVIANDHEVIRRTLGPGVYLFGRLPSCDFQISGQLVAPEHARLTIAENGIPLLEDLGSPMGTFLDGHRLTAPTSVTPNQTALIGTAQITIRGQSPEVASERQATVETTTPKKDGTPPELAQTTRYETVVEFAKGGMGAVFIARQPALRREVAMKVMLRNDSQENRLRFIEEAQVTGQLEHPNIVPVHDLALDEFGQPYYTMKLVRGLTLKTILRRLKDRDSETIGKYSLATLLSIFQKVCDAVAFAHARNVIHRDLKPDNIMIGRFGEVFVMDWGLAKVITTCLTDSLSAPANTDLHLPPVQSARADQPGAYSTLNDVVMGTPAYMSPEQAAGEIEWLDTRSDIFSLGSILYEIVTLFQPFTGSTSGQILEKVKAGDFVHPNDRLRSEKGKIPPHIPGGSVPRPIEDIILKALALQCAQRYSSVKDLQADLTAFQNGFALSVNRGGTRNESRFLLAAATGVLALIGSFAAFSGAVSNERRVSAQERIRTQEERDRADKAEVATIKAQDALANVRYDLQQADDDRVRLQQKLKNVQDELKALPVPPTPEPAATVKKQHVVVVGDRSHPFVNSLGMKFVPISITGGSTNGQTILFSIWDTRVQDFASFPQNDAREEPAFRQGPTHPVVMVSFDEAKAFCAWLTAKERSSGTIGERDQYRLPSDHEWSCAVGIGDQEDPSAAPQAKDEKIEKL